MSKDIRELMNGLSLKIDAIKYRCSDNDFYNIIGINYMIALIKTVQESERNRIFSSEDYTNDGGGFSRNFLIGRWIKLNFLLDEFYDIHSLSYEELIEKRKEDLDERLKDINEDDRKWFNENGIYSLYEGILRGYITPAEFGSQVAGIIDEIVIKKISRL